MLFRSVSDSESSTTDVSGDSDSGGGDSGGSDRTALDPALALVMLMAAAMAVVMRRAAQPVQRLRGA